MDAADLSGYRVFGQPPPKKRGYPFTFLFLYLNGVGMLWQEHE